ncbi:MAG: serine/threonine-protein kinase [Myxococcota bacterium]
MPKGGVVAPIAAQRVGSGEFDSEGETGRRIALGDAPTQQGGDAHPGGELRRGANTGRYRILDVLGRGAMGVVYRAYDPRLGRHVALKVPHADHCDGAPDESESGLPRDSAPTMRARFVQEARGLAQLSHPNVVQVYSVEHFSTVPGLSRGACGIAMEVVEGIPLDRWMTKHRTWREALAVFAEAGRGLACAHAAGLVHRDFKPSNVVLGDDGRVRVMDFGLVTMQRDPDGDRYEPTTMDHDLDATLTQTGTTLGTPAYMAPEQHLGAPAEAASDQFAFCVALFEALFGVRPYRGMSCDDLSADKQLGRRRRIPEGHGVPPQIVAAVLRGLSPAPSERFANMNELLGQLSPRRRVGPLFRSVVAAVGLALVGMGGGFLMPETTVTSLSHAMAGISIERGAPSDDER